MSFVAIIAFLYLVFDDVRVAINGRR